jgi:alpha-L-fucosidase
VPEWYCDAKLGIFIHWGLYSVPAYADPEGDDRYAEWYPYYMHKKGSDTWKYHQEHYGEAHDYIDFLEDWEAENWNPAAWAEFFADIGARYVVLTAEHHDGFPLWESHYTKYNAAEMGPQRDIVRELCDAVREQGLRFAGSYHANLNYYQPGFEGLYGHPDYHELEQKDDQKTHSKPGSEYVDFMNAKHRELIRRYEPDLLWFDTPHADADHLRSRELIAEYYNRAQKWGKSVAVNDRASTDDNALAGPDPESDGEPGGDFGSPEYATLDEPKSYKWETCRGIGHSFGYNAAETSEHHMDGTELVRLLVDVVSKNGNLLVNIGPRSDGTIPEEQKKPLEKLGQWLDTNGEAIFGTDTWKIAEDPVSAVPVRYTRSDDTVFAIAFQWPGESLELGIQLPETSQVPRPQLLGFETDIDSVPTQAGTRIQLPTDAPEPAPAYAIALPDVS